MNVPGTKKSHAPKKPRTPLKDSNKPAQEIATKTAKTDANKKRFLSELGTAWGNVSQAVRATGISKSQAYNWKKEDLDFARSWAESRDIAKDFVESKLMELIDGEKVEGSGENGAPIIYTRPPCKTSIIFYLKTQAKDRGYTERIEVEQVNQVRVTVEIVGNDEGS